MNKYDPDIRYFGPQGESKMNQFIPAFPPGCEIVKDAYNRAGWLHDGGYDGCRRTGVWGWIKDLLERRSIDLDFRDYMLNANESIRNSDDRKTADLFAEAAFIAVRAGGWKYFRTGEKAVPSGKVKLVSID